MGQPGQAPGVDKRLDLSCISTQGVSQGPGRDLSQGPGCGLLLFLIQGLSQDLTQDPGQDLSQGLSQGPGQDPGDSPPYFHYRGTIQFPTQDLCLDLSQAPGQGPGPELCIEHSIGLCKRIA